LANEITTLVGHPEKVTAMEQASRTLARGDAAKATVDLIEELVGQRMRTAGGRRQKQ
jgi:UDP-N-acetylglucosamine:LPS N-acetylglucosamine transferase